MDFSSAFLAASFWAFAIPIALSFPLGWSMFRSLDRPPDVPGRGFDALPDVPLPLARAAKPAADGLEALRLRVLGLQCRAVR